MGIVAPINGTDGVHAESCLRDQGHLMAGHHCHSCYELFYIESGACRFLIDNHIFDLREGDFILVPPLTLHYTRYVFGPCRRTIVLFRQEDILDEVRQSLPNAAQLFSETAFFSIQKQHRDRVLRLIVDMTQEDSAAGGHSPLILKLLLQELLLVCGRECDFFFEPPADIHTSDQHVLKAARFIALNYMDPVTSADVARAVGFSANYLSRKFREATGIGLHEYIVFVRLQHAAQDLISTADSIITIALRCGFSDSNYFKDSFKKKYGMTPRTYRKQFPPSMPPASH